MAAGRGCHPPRLPLLRIPARIWFMTRDECGAGMHLAGIHDKKMSHPCVHATVIRFIMDPGLKHAGVTVRFCRALLGFLESRLGGPCFAGAGAGTTIIGAKIRQDDMINK